MQHYRTAQKKCSWDPIADVPANPDRVVDSAAAWEDTAGRADEPIGDVPGRTTTSRAR